MIALDGHNTNDYYPELPKLKSDWSDTIFYYRREKEEAEAELRKAEMEPDELDQGKRENFGKADFFVEFNRATKAA